MQELGEKIVAVEPEHHTGLGTSVIWELSLMFCKILTPNMVLVISSFGEERDLSGPCALIYDTLIGI